VSLLKNNYASLISQAFNSILMPQSKSKYSQTKVLSNIQKDIKLLRERMLEKVPGHFSQKDIINAFLGAMFIGLTFILRTDIIDIAINLDSSRVILIVFSTFLILTAEIYFIGYSRVPNKKTRPFGQFWAKRFVSLYIVTILVSLFLVYIFGINTFVNTGEEVFKIVVLVSMPCAVGAAIPSLLTKY